MTQRLRTLPSLLVVWIIGLLYSAPMGWTRPGGGQHYFGGKSSGGSGWSGIWDLVWFLDWEFLVILGVGIVFFALLILVVYLLAPKESKSKAATPKSTSGPNPSTPKSSSRSS